MRFKTPAERAEDFAIIAASYLKQGLPSRNDPIGVSVAFALASIAHSLEIIAEHHARQAGTGGNS